MPTRRLAAIMFTDIAGYTKLMQQSEARANALRTRHREVFESSHQTYNGQIIQYFGDGTLSTFDSCVEAVHCAIEMQKAFQEEPQVPLRIGIHLGDIVWSEKDVMGDGVNLASRVESLGIPGSILISDDVNKQIKNQEIETVNMGTFGMKNVDTPLEVFAVEAEGVALPSPKDLKGKGKRLNNILKAHRLVQFASVGFLAMAIGALIFWASGAQERAQLLPESIREEKVAVSVFENFTGDENLDALGYLGSEWISSGLRELKVRTVSPEMVRQNKETIGILPDNPQGKPSFAEITGAKYVVAGSYFLEGDSILLKTRLSSTETGEDIRTFPTIRGHKDQREKLVEEARQYLLGFWVWKRDNKLSNINPPTYEAYQAYLDCFSPFYPCYREVVDMDPDFLLARIQVVATSGLWGADEDFWKNKRFLEKRWDQCTEFEKNLFDYAVARYEGNPQEAFDALNKNFQLDPQNIEVIHQSAYVASAELNRIDIAIERLEYLFDNKDIYESNISGVSIGNYMDALIRQKEYQKVIDFYSALSDPLQQRGGSSEFMIALIYQGQTEEAEKIYIQKGRDKGTLIDLAYMYSYIYPDSSNNPFAEELAGRIGEYDDFPIVEWGSTLNTSRWRFLNSKFLAYYILKDWDQAEKALNKLEDFDWDTYYKQFPFPVATTYINQEILWLVAALGCVYAHQGRVEESMTQIEQVTQLGKQYNDGTRSDFLRGGTSYLKARIYAVLGEKAKAVEELRKSLEQGKVIIWWTVTFDLDFVNLKGYPPFEALVAPRTEK